MLLAGDVGGTNTRLGLFRQTAIRPAQIDSDEFKTLDYDGLEPMVQAFLHACRIEPSQIDAACFGVAGALKDQVAQLTNVPWVVDGRAVAKALGIPRTRLLNDLEAMAYGVTLLEGDELVVLQRGESRREGNAAVIAAGTGLGEALLHRVDGRLIPSPSEGGHADFAARTPRELEMVAALTRVFGRVGVEHVISGPGIANIYQFTHDAFGAGPLITPNSLAPARVCDAIGAEPDAPDLPARITRAAQEGRCPHCVETLAIFVSAYGAEAGNLALRMFATAGVYVGGGIAPKILDTLREGAFMDAFRAKPPMHELVAAMPVSVILNSEVALLGAAAFAQWMARAEG